MDVAANMAEALWSAAAAAAATAEATAAEDEDEDEAVDPVEFRKSEVDEPLMAEEVGRADEASLPYLKDFS